MVHSMTVLAERVRLAWDFPSDYSTSVTATSSAGNMGVANLFNQQPSIRWRSTSTSDQVISGTFPELTNVKFLLLYAHNLFGGASVKLELSDDNFSTTKATYIWGYYDDAEGFGMDLFGMRPFGGIGERSGRFPFVLEFVTEYLEDDEETILYPDGCPATHWKVTLSDSTNIDGYIEAGRLALGDYWSPEECNAVYGYNWKRIRAKAGEGKETRNGGWRSSKRPTYRQFSFSFDFLTANDEAFLDNLFFNAGDSQNVLVVMYPKEAAGLYKRHLALGFLVEDDGLTRNDALYRGSSLTIREAL
jgi:hypothetical protein